MTSMFTPCLRSNRFAAMYSFRMTVKPVCSVTEVTRGMAAWPRRMEGLATTAVPATMPAPLSKRRREMVLVMVSPSIFVS